MIPSGKKMRILSTDCVWDCKCLSWVTSISWNESLSLTLVGVFSFNTFTHESLHLAFNRNLSTSGSTELQASGDGSERGSPARETVDGGTGLAIHAKLHTSRAYWTNIACVARLCGQRGGSDRGQHPAQPTALTAERGRKVSQHRALQEQRGSLQDRDGAAGF